MNNKQRKDIIKMPLLGLLAGCLSILTAILQHWTPLRLPKSSYNIVFFSGIAAIIVYGIYLLRKHPLLSRTWGVFAVSAALFLNTIGLASANYIGPQRTVTTTTWERQYCNYRATVTSPAGTCFLTLYFSPGSCPSTSSVAGYFNNAPTACGTSWPGTCGSGLSCTITLLSGSTVPCSSGETGCAQTTHTTTYPPATVSGTTVCTLPGNAGWCRGVATLNLSGNEPLAPTYSLTYFEGTPGTLCSAPSCAWDFPEGVTSLDYWVHSTFGDTSTLSSATMRVDSVAPILTLTIPSPDGQNGWYISAVTAQATASDATSGVSGVPSINGGSNSFTVSTDGTHNLIATVSDVAGNTATSSGTIQLDTTAPIPGFSLPAPDGQNGWYITPVTITPNGSDATSGVGIQVVSLDNTNWYPSVTISTDGTYIIYNRISDVAGNTATSSTTVKLDTTSPSVTVTIPVPDGDGGWYATQTLFSTSESDALSGVALTEYSVDGGTWQTTAPTLSDGSHTVQVRVTDQAGNITTTTTTVNVDTTPPSSAFAYPAEGSTTVVHGTIVMSGSTGDLTSGAAGAEISLDNGATWMTLSLGTGGSWSYTWDTTSAGNGAHTILVRATDTAGNLEHTAQITIVVSNDPPHVSITPLWTVYGHADVSITAGSSPVDGAKIIVSDPDGRWPDAVTEYSSGNLPTQFKWLGKMGDGSIAYAGKYLVTVRAWDSYGNYSEATGWVLILLPPTETPTPTEIPATSEPLSTPTQQPTAVALPATTAQPVTIQSQEPEPVNKIKTPVIQRIIWPAFAFIGLLAVLASASLSDRRPRELRALAKAMDATREIQKSYPNED